tara:strand:- start:582 stop:1418 length:837 start_codon:yes stop_codon:yes gene_type:complete
MNVEKRPMVTEKKRGRGRPRKVQNVVAIPSLIDFDKITKLNDLDIDSRMLESMQIGIPSLDNLFSFEKGIPCSSNTMIIGDPGVGKTTVMLDILASVQNRDRKCLFISGEMGRKQMFKYTERFKHFGIVETLFMSDYLDYNTKDVMEQVLDRGYDCVLIDSIAEVLSGVRDDNGWDRKTAEAWLVENCVRNNKGENKENKFTSFLLIQQVTKSGEFVGSNRLKHMTDSLLEMRRESERDGGGTYMSFQKNRNGNVEDRMNFFINNSTVEYSSAVNVNE